MEHQVFQYQLRYAIKPGHFEDERIAELLDFCQRANIDDVIFFISAEEINNGHLTKEEAAPYVASIKKAKKQLDKINVTTSINPWFTFGHGDRGRKLKAGQKFGTMVDRFGRQADVMACPADEAWIAYYIDYLNYLSDEIHPSTIWLEDDFRLLNHEPLAEGGCFCSKHMALYSAYLGEEVTRENFVKAMLGHGPLSDRYRKCYQEVNGALLEKIAHRLSEGMRDKKVRLSLMSGDPRAEALEGRNPYLLLNGFRTAETPFHRIHLPSYREIAPQEYIRDFACQSLREAAWSSSDFPIRPELENVPHTILSKSVAFSEFQIASSLALGSSGITLSIFDFVGNGIFEGDGFASMLKADKPFLNAVASLNLDPRKLQGPKVLVSKDTCLYRVNDPADGLNGLWPDDSEWPSLFSGLGIPFSFQFADGISGEVVAVGGDTLQCLSDIQIKDLFKNNHVMADGRSVLILKARGLLSLLGAAEASIIPERNGQVALEEVDSSFVIYGKEGYLYPAQYFVGDFVSVSYLDSQALTVYSFATDYNGENKKNAVVVSGSHFVLPYAIKKSDIFPSFVPQAEVGLVSAEKKVLLEHYLLQFMPHFIDIQNLGLASYLFASGKTCYLMVVNPTLDCFNSISINGLFPNGPIKALSKTHPVWTAIETERKPFGIKAHLALSPLETVVLSFECEAQE